ncbi:MAG: mitochondrial fission ELM1 family protein [Lysobacterales bacterium]
MTIYSDGAAGNELPALALASALSTEPASCVRLRAPWPQSLWLPHGPVLNPTRWQPPLDTSTWPELAIGAGRMGAAALLSVRRAGKGQTRTIQILDPRIDPARYDIVIAPAHDRLSGPNVIVIEGSLHAINDAWIRRERLAHAPLGRLPSPRTVVLIGGRRRGVKLGHREIERLAETLQNWQSRDGGSLLLLGSRRTPKAWQDALRRALPKADLRWFSAADGDNPYRGAIAWGDRFIVTADSVNMLSEALGTGQPVYSLCAGVPAGKLGVFHRGLVESGRLRPLRTQPAVWNYPPLRELERVVPLVREMLSRVTG